MCKLRNNIVVVLLMIFPFSGYVHAGMFTVTPTGVATDLGYHSGCFITISSLTPINFTEGGLSCNTAHVGFDCSGEVYNNMIGSSLAFSLAVAAVKSGKQLQVYIENPTKVVPSTDLCIARQVILRP